MISMIGQGEMQKRSVHCEEKQARGLPGAGATTAAAGTAGLLQLYTPNAGTSCRGAVSGYVA